MRGTGGGKGPFGGRGGDNPPPPQGGTSWSHKAPVRRALAVESPRRMTQILTATATGGPALIVFEAARGILMTVKLAAVPQMRALREKPGIPAASLTVEGEVGGRSTMVQSVMVPLWLTLMDTLAKGLFGLGGEGACAVFQMVTEERMKGYAKRT
jgi:hypothetical protein